MGGVGGRTAELPDAGVEELNVKGVLQHLHVGLQLVLLLLSLLLVDEPGRGSELFGRSEHVVLFLSV